MIIDDEPIVGKRIKILLEKRGYEVEAFVDGEKALDTLAARKFDIVITDLKMGEIDGISILEIINREYPGTKVIIITGVGKWLTATEAFNKGAFDFVIKPFKFEELENVIKKAEVELKGE